MSPLLLIVALIPKAPGPVTLDGNLDEWAGAIVAPVHVGHPDFANRGAQFLLMWDEQNLYVGLRCLDRTPAHVMPDNQLWNGDAVEFYLDARTGDKLGAKKFGPGTLHLFFTGFTGTEVKPRVRLRDLPEFKGMTLQGAEAAAKKTPWGYTVEFKLPWANCPGFTPKPGAELGMECELCSGDGGPRVDRTFTFSSPAAVGSPSAFGRVQLVEKLTPKDLGQCSRALLPVSVNQSANYPWLYVTAGVSPALGESVKPSARLLDQSGAAKKTAAFTHKTVADSPLSLWQASFELFDLPPGDYTLEVTAGPAKRLVPIRHGPPAPPAAARSWPSARCLPAIEPICQGTQGERLNSTNRFGSGLTVSHHTRKFRNLGQPAAIGFLRDLHRLHHG